MVRLSRGDLIGIDTVLGSERMDGKAMRLDLVTYQFRVKVTRMVNPDVRFRRPELL